MENNKTPANRNNSFRLSSELTQRLEQRLSPQMLQSMEILQLPTLELQLLIKQEMEINPTLELFEEQDLARDKTDDEAKDDKTDDEKTTPESDTVEILDKGRETPTTERSNRQQSGIDRKWEAMQNVADKPASLQDYLYQQVKFIETDETTQNIAKYIIFNIDNNGFLNLTDEEIAQATQSTPEAVKAVLNIIQQLDPPGVCARNLSECLMLQLSEDDPNLKLKQQIIGNYMEDIKMNRLPLVADIIGKSIDEIQQAVQEISQLNPSPGNNFSRELSPHIVPDVFMIENDGDYEIRLNNDYVPNLRINQYYQKMLSDPATPPETKEYIKKKIEAANIIVLAIQQRQNTILRVAREIVKAQKEFFEKGMSYLKPLKMQDIAGRLGIHITTVSRAITSKPYSSEDNQKMVSTRISKYIQTPRGIFSLKFFFTRSTEGSMDEWQSVKSVLSMLQELISQEDKTATLSDAEIIKYLEGKGVKIARRTVAKYRQMLNIPSSKTRKKY